MPLQPPVPAKGKRPVYLIGDPVDHSLSPFIHNTAFQAQKLDLEYIAWRVEGGDVQNVLTRLDETGAAGANVTVPHKRAVHDLVDDLSNAAATTGAVNTLVRRPAGWRGENTDVEGFLAPLRDTKFKSAGGAALVLGAGGAARAVTVALLTKYTFKNIVVVSRRAEQAESLCETSRNAVASHSLPPSRSGGRATLLARPIDTVLEIQGLFSPTLVINTTPVGMHPLEDACPLPKEFDFHGVDVAYDLIYNPPETEFLRRARGYGADTINGLPMLVAQAAASFRLWTGREMDLDAVRSALTGSS